MNKSEFESNKAVGCDVFKRTDSGDRSTHNIFKCFEMLNLADF